MGNFTDDKIRTIWNKSIIVEKITVDGKEIKIDTNRYRQDACNAWIEWGEYGNETDFGWEIDHILPEAKNGTDHTDNLRPFHWKNNRKKSDDFPDYTQAITSNSNKNKEVEYGKTVNESTLQKLKQIYPNSPYLK